MIVDRWSFNSGWMALKHVFSAIVVCLLSAFAWASPIELTIFSVNDFHGHVQSQSPVPGWSLDKNSVGQSSPLGGLAHLATALKQHSQSKQRTDLMGVGDLIGASPLASSLVEDQVTFQGLSDLGMTLSVLGNHEFDRGQAWLSQQQNLDCAQQKQSACKFLGFKKLGFTYLAANVAYRYPMSSQTQPYPSHVILDIGGVRVAVIGLITKDTPSLVMPSGVSDLVFKDEISTLEELLPSLRTQGIQSFVVLLHEGGFMLESERA
jgi:5'-nucleotidase